MLQEQLLEQLQRLRAELDNAEAQLKTADVPVPVLEDLKQAVDHLRLALLGVAHSTGDDKYEAAAAIIRSRLQRTGELCRQIVADIDAQEVTVDSPELKELHELLAGTVSRIHQLYKTGR
jgi:hypothetical protein